MRYCFRLFIFLLPQLSFSALPKDCEIGYVVLPPLGANLDQYIDDINKFDPALKKQKKTIIECGAKPVKVGKNWYLPVVTAPTPNLWF